MSLENAFKTKPSIIPYITLGDPDISQSEALIHNCAAAGADLIEIGIPFSDPIADGPTIQASHFRALEKNPDLSLDDAFALVSRVRKRTTVPLAFMLASNLVLQYGIERTFKTARAKKLDAIIIPDLSLETCDPYYNASQKSGVPLIFLISPLTPKERINAILKKAEGFIYLISSTGTTGERKTMSKDLKKIVATIKSIKPIPVAVGFGISTKDHIKEVHSYADAAIIGSHFVSDIEENPKAAQTKIPKKIRNFKI